jgi:hypothetical protein
MKEGEEMGMGADSMPIELEASSGLSRQAGGSVGVRAVDGHGHRHGHGQREGRRLGELEGDGGVIAEVSGDGVDVCGRRDRGGFMFKK